MTYHEKCRYIEIDKHETARVFDSERDAPWPVFYYCVPLAKTVKACRAEEGLDEINQMHHKLSTLSSSAKVSTRSEWAEWVRRGVSMLIDLCAMVTKPKYTSEKAI